MPSGYGTFIARLATGLPVQLQSPVQSITYGGSLVTIATTTGQTYQARTVIVTASTAVLASGSIAFSPALPPAYVSALADLPMGHAYKIMLGFTSNPFNGRLGTQPGKMRNFVPLVDAPTPAFSVNYFAEEYPNAGTFMVATAEGPDVDTYEAMGATNAAKAILQLVEAPFPGVTKAWNGQAIASSWSTNPYTRGCISFAKPGKTAARVQLAKPLGNQAWFAGEALSIHAHSLVHGAWESGTAAAYGALASIGVLGG
jgi:monoamine oxidase